MEICYPQYGSCIANLACSILGYYGCDAPNPSLPQADALLQKAYKNVVLLLLDGMGVSTLEKHLSAESALRVFIHLSANDRSRHHGGDERAVSQSIRVAGMGGLF